MSREHEREQTSDDEVPKDGKLREPVPTNDPLAAAVAHLKDAIVGAIKGASAGMETALAAVAREVVANAQLQLVTAIAPVRSAVCHEHSEAGQAWKGQVIIGFDTAEEAHAFWAVVNAILARKAASSAGGTVGANRNPTEQT